MNEDPTVWEWKSTTEMPHGCYHIELQRADGKTHFCCTCDFQGSDDTSEEYPLFRYDRESYEKDEEEEEFYSVFAAGSVSFPEEKLALAKTMLDGVSSTLDEEIEGDHFF